jgi:thioredoxin-related protein
MNYMKRKFSLFAILSFVCAITLSFITRMPYDELAIGTAIPQGDVAMADVSGETTSLSKSKTEKGILVIFTCNTCPYVKLSEQRIKQYSDFCLANGIGCVLVNSNEAQRGEDDSFDKMKAYYSEQKLACKYVMDAKSGLANAFGATRTPQCFLFNSKSLIYKGAIDDNVKDAKAVKSSYLQDALSALLKNQNPATQETKSIGCTIKRTE